MYDQRGPRRIIRMHDQMVGRIGQQLDALPHQVGVGRGEVEAPERDGGDEWWRNGSGEVMSAGRRRTADGDPTPI
jgi:hypothetical protein